jgi:hypothetical protein
MPLHPTAAELAQELRGFDELPEDAVVRPRISRAVRGGISEWADRRSPPPIPRIQISKKLWGHRVGDLRALIRGKIPQTT